MAQLTDDQFMWLRAELGASLTFTDLQDRYDRLGSVRDVAIEVLRSRRSEWTESPMSVSLSGVASVSYSENVKAVDSRLTQLARLDEDPSSDVGEDAAAIAGGGTAARGSSVVRLTRSRGR